MLHRVMPAPLKDVHEADQIGVHVGVRILERVTDPGLGRQMHHPLRPVTGKQRRHRAAVRHVHALVGKAGLPEQSLQPGLLQADVVIVVEVIDTNDFVTPCQQPPGHMEADEPRASRYQNPHAPLLRRSRRS